MAKKKVTTPKKSTAPKKPTTPKKESPKSKKAVPNRRSSQTSSAQSSPVSQRASRSFSQSTLSKVQESSIRKPVPKKKSRRPQTRMMIVGNKMFKITTKIFREIKQYQMSTKCLLPKLPFSKLIHEILSQCAPSGARVQRLALDALQESAEAYLVQFFEDSYCCALHARRSTLLPRDMGLIQYLRHDQ